VTSRKWMLLLLLAAALGAATVILPAIASSETAPTITAENLPGGIYGEGHRWAPATATVAENGVVSFSNPTEVPHGIEWISTPGSIKPACSGVPVGTGEADSGTKWSGTCTFTAAGSYHFYCTVHHAAMSGTVTVDSDGTTTTTMTMPTNTVSTSQTTPGATPTSTGAPTSTGGAPLTAASPLAGSASTAVEVARTQRGPSVHGSLAVSAAGAGGRLSVELLARRASLASAPGVQVGRTLRSVSAGRVRFAVALDARARRALKRAHRLALSVRITLTPLHGAPLTLTRAVVLGA
jgi:plastocyanin